MRDWVSIQNIDAAGRLPCIFWGMSLLHQSKRNQLFKGWSDTFSSTDITELLLLPPISSYSLATATPQCTGVPVLVLYSLPDLGLVPVYKCSTGMKPSCEGSRHPRAWWDSFIHSKSCFIWNHCKFMDTVNPYHKTKPCLCVTLLGRRVCLLNPG